MPDTPYPITSDDPKQAIKQMKQLVDELFQERIAGATIGDVFQVGEDDVLSLRLAESGGLIKTESTLSTDNTILQFKSEKGIASGYAGLDIAAKVPTLNLGGTGADNTKFLRGDQTWNVPSGVSHTLLSATHSDTVVGSPVSGDIIYGNATPNWTKLAKGTDGYFLKLASGLPSWSALPTTSPGGSDTYIQYNYAGVFGGSQFLKYNYTDAILFAQNLQVKNPWADVTAYGAVGDNSTDDTTAIQNAIGGLDATLGGILFFPRGTYKVTSALNIDRPVQIVGVGKAGSFIAIASNTAHLLNVTSISKCSVRNIALIVHSSITARTNSAALLYNNGDNREFVVDNVRFDGTGGGAVQQGTGIRKLKGAVFTVLYSRFWNCIIGISIEPDDPPNNGDTGGDDIVYGNAFNGTNQGLYAVYQTCGGGLKLEGNKFWNHQYQYYLDVADGAVTGQLIIVGNSFDGPGTYAITITRSAGTGLYGAFVITGNFFATTRPISIGGSQMGGVISGNYIGSGGGGGDIGIEILAGTDWSISGNTIIGCTTGILLTNVAGVSRIEIGSNHFYNNGTDVSDVGNKAILTLKGKVVTEGAADSGGTGYKLLRVPN